MAGSVAGSGLSPRACTYSRQHADACCWVRNGNVLLSSNLAGLTYFTVLSVDTMHGRSISSRDGGASIIKRARG
jgi:hypothetical protein